MCRTLDQIATDFDALTVQDFENGNGLARLDQLCDELRQGDGFVNAAPLLFQTMERLFDAELGMPGPIVHTLEAMPDYRPHLIESIHRRPTSLTVWMVNRILNSKPKDSSDWLNLLRSVAEHSLACDIAKDEARDFLEYQANCGG